MIEEDLPSDSRHTGRGDKSEMIRTGSSFYNAFNLLDINSGLVLDMQAEPQGTSPQFQDSAIPIRLDSQALSTPTDNFKMNSMVLTQSLLE